MDTTLGELIADLYDAFTEYSHDPALAAVATAAAVNDLLCDAAHRDRQAREAARDVAPTYRAEAHAGL